MSNEVPATEKDTTTPMTKTTDVEAVDVLCTVESTEVQGTSAYDKMKEFVNKPVSTVKAFSGGTPEHHPTPITKRSLRDMGFQPEQTNIWSNGMTKLQYDDVADTWRLLSTNQVVNFIEEVKA